MDNSFRYNVAFASVAVLAIRIILAGRRQIPAASGITRHVIHPGGHLNARLLAEAILRGFDTQFFDLFRMHQHTFKVLVA